MALILFHVREADDPATAAKHLTHDVDEITRTYVRLAAKPTEEVAPAACLELAAWYQGQAEGASSAIKLVVLSRAAGYYGRFLADGKASGAAAERASQDVRRQA